MVNYNVTVGGEQLQNVYEVSTETSTREKIGKAIIVGADGDVSGFNSGDRVVVEKNNRVEFTGFLISTPRKGRNDPEIEIEAWSRKSQLKFEDVKRTFYDMDTGEIIRRAISEQSYNLDARTLHKGSSTSGWESDVPVFELAKLRTQDLQERGSDLIFCGFREGSNGDYYARFDVPSSDLPTPKGLIRLTTRIMANTRGGQFDIAIELCDSDGTQYVWNGLSLRGEGFETYELNAQEASPNGEVTEPNTLEYRFNIKADLPDPRALLIDYATATSYAVEERDTELDVFGVQDTGNRIIRRFDGNVLELVTDLELEDDFISYIDEDAVVHYEPLGDTQAPKQIDYDTTPVTEASFNRDYSRIKNKVTVQGAGDIQVTLREEASIRFYGISPRHEPVTDTEIQSRQDAIKRGQGYLRENAWDDTALEFEVADASFADVRVGQSMLVRWPPENIDREWVVTDVSTADRGFVKIALSGVV